jgi:hypothetical protein
MQLRPAAGSRTVEAMMRAVLLVLFACTSAEPVVTTTEAPAKQRDPKGPCTRTEGARCAEYDAQFTAANATATARFPVDSGQTRGPYYAKVELPKGKTLAISVEHLGTTTPVPRLTIHRWESADDGWVVRSDSFTPAEPTARFGTDVGPTTAATLQLFAVVAEPATDFRVTITAR